MMKVTISRRGVYVIVERSVKKMEERFLEKEASNEHTYHQLVGDPTPSSVNPAKKASLKTRTRPGGKLIAVWGSIGCRSKALNMTTTERCIDVKSSKVSTGFAS